MRSEIQTIWLQLPKLDQQHAAHDQESDHVKKASESFQGLAFPDFRISWGIDLVVTFGEFIRFFISVIFHGTDVTRTEHWQQCE